jgi:predicted nucleic acid-binding protein
LIIVDSSAWIEYLRRSGSREHHRVRDLLGEGGDLATTATILLEVLAGAGDESEAVALERLLGRCAFLAADEPLDAASAAAIYRVCRRAGETLRAIPDCLIAAVAIRTGSALLHRDSDFEAIARHAPLELLAA